MNNNPNQPSLQDLLSQAFDQVYLSQDQLDTGRSQLLGQIKPSPLPSWFKYARWPLGLVVTALIVITSLQVTRVAADSSKPGDPLYPLDRLIEKVQLAMTKDPQQKKLIKEQIIRERIDELAQITNQRQQEEQAHNKQQEQVVNEVDQQLEQQLPPEASGNLNKIRHDLEAAKAGGPVTASESAAIKQTIKEALSQPAVKGSINSATSTTPDPTDQPAAATTASTPTTDTSPQPSPAATPESDVEPVKPTPSPDPRYLGPPATAPARIDISPSDLNPSL